MTVPQLESLDRSSADGRSLIGPLYRHTGVFAGSRFRVLYSLDRTEHSRRLETGITGTTDERLLAALLSLPVDDLGVVPVRFRNLFSNPATAALALIVDAPDGTRWGQNRIAAPLQVLEIETPAMLWRSGSDLAHRWVGYGPRTVRISGMEKIDMSIVLSEADLYGFGVTLGNERLIEPAPYDPQKWSAARWQFAETIYAQFREATAALGI